MAAASGVAPKDPRQAFCALASSPRTEGPAERVPVGLAGWCQSTVNF